MTIARTNPQDDILRILAIKRRPMKASEIAAETGWANSTIRSNLHVLGGGYHSRRSWVAEVQSHPKQYVLTAVGLEIAGMRKLTRRTTLTPAEHKALR